MAKLTITSIASIILLLVGAILLLLGALGGGILLIISGAVIELIGFVLSRIALKQVKVAK